MRVVFDTNVVVAGIVAEGLCREILEIHVPEHTAILSQVCWPRHWPAKLRRS
jgi:predicted nucleic acid-binding protein